MTSISKIALAKGPTAFVREGTVRFTPAQANAVFTNCRYEFNRNEARAKHHIAALARMMADSQWRDRAVIEFARTPDGKLTLIDGHHRMLAQVEAGVDVTWTIIIHDVADEEERRNLFWTYDTTLRKRTMANVMDGVNAAETMGLKRPVALALAKAVTFIDNGMQPPVGAGTRAYTPAEKLTLAAEWQPEAALFGEDIEGAAITIKRKLWSAQITAVALITYRAAPESARKFWQGIAADDGLRQGDPRKTLLDWLRNTHLAGSGYTASAVAVARAWAAWEAGRKLTMIRVGTAPCQIVGTKIVVHP